MPTVEELRDPVGFIESQFIVPETGQPLRLLDWQKRILRHLFAPDDQGHYPYSDIVWSLPKKGGKTTIGAAVGLWAAFTWERNNEVYFLANDQEQAKSRSFSDLVTAIEHNQALSQSAYIRQTDVALSTGTQIKAIASDYTGESGTRHGLALFDELWAFVTESSRRLWEEFTPLPCGPGFARRNSLRFVTTTAGFVGESHVLLDLYRRGVEQGERVPGLEDLPCYRSGRLFILWSHNLADGPTPVPWVSGEYLADQRESLRPAQYRRLHGNEWCKAESKNPFLRREQIEALVQPGVGELNPTHDVELYGALDVGTRSDMTSLTFVCRDPATDKPRVAVQRFRQGSADQPLDLANTLDEFVCHQVAPFYDVRILLYDLSQAEQSTAKFKRYGVPCESFPPSPGNLAAASRCLHTHAASGNLILPGDMPETQRLCEHLENAVCKMVAGEDGENYYIVKPSPAKKVDGAVSAGMALLALTRNESGSVAVWSTSDRAEAPMPGYNQLVREYQEEWHRSKCIKRLCVSLPCYAPLCIIAGIRQRGGRE